MEKRPDRSVFLYFRDWEDNLMGELHYSTPPLDHIKDFIERAVAAAPRITCIEDRHDLRRSLRYWASILSLQGEPYPDIDIDREGREPELLESRGSSLPLTKDGCKFEILYLHKSRLDEETVKNCFRDYDTSRLMSVRRLISEACRAYGRVQYAQCDVSVDDSDTAFVTIFAPSSAGTIECLGIVKVHTKEQNRWNGLSI